MLLAEMFDPAISLRKTVWSKRGQRIEKREVSKIAATDVQPRKRIVTTDEETLDEA